MSLARLDLNILRALSVRSRYFAYRDVLPKEMLDPNTSALLGWFKLYYESYKDHKLIETSCLLTLMRLRHPDNPDAMLVFEQVIAQLDQPIDETTLQVTMQTLEELRMSGEAASLVAAFQRGQERVASAGAATWASEDPLVYFEAEADGTGLQFNCLPPLADSLKGCRPGKNIAIAMPTDAGKTSLLCLIAVDMATQAARLVDTLEWLRDAEGNPRPLLYLVNEGTAEAITPRVYQTAVQRTFDDTLAMARDGTLVPAYIKKVGRQDAIRVINIHGKSVGQVYRIIEAHKPYLVISDMTGRIRSAANQTGGKNDVGQVEDVWNTMRENAAILNFIHIGTVQVSSEGFDQLYPPLSALQDSKVGIQTTLDLCIMGGKLLAASMEDIRGISTPKNKLAKSGRKSTNLFETWFDPTTNTWSTGQDIPGAKK